MEKPIFTSCPVSWTRTASMKVEDRLAFQRFATRRHSVHLIMPTSICWSLMRFAAAFAVVSTAALVLFAGPARAEGDAEAGERVFNRCKACHTIEEGDSPKMGPNLYGVFGRQAGSAPPGSLNTTAMEESGIVWDDETLTLWLAAPTDLIEGTKMTFRLTKEQEIADVIAYLKANSPDAN